MTGVYYRKHIEEGFYHNEINNAYHSTDPMDSFADQINSYDPQYVIDAGCGQNIWKNKVQNVTGFDWAHLETHDYTCEYSVFDEHTQPGTADFVFCLGSIHTSHSQEDKAGEIYSNLKYVHKWLKPGGRAIMRVRSDVESLYRPRKNLRWPIFMGNR